MSILAKQRITHDHCDQAHQGASYHNSKIHDIHDCCCLCCYCQLQPRGSKSLLHKFISRDRRLHRVQNVDWQPLRMFYDSPKHVRSCISRACIHRLDWLRWKIVWAEIWTKQTWNASYRGEASTLSEHNLRQDTTCRLSSSSSRLCEPQRLHLVNHLLLAEGFDLIICA